MADGYLLEAGTDRLLLEDGSGIYVLDEPVPVPVPTGLTAAAGSALSVNLTWTNIAYQSIVKIYRDTTLIYTSGLQAASSAGSYNDPGLTLGQLYSYTISATMFTEGAQSSASTFTVIAVTDLVPSADVVFPSSSSQPSGSITAAPRWSKVDDGWGSISDGTSVDLTMTLTSHYPRFITALTDLASDLRITGITLGGYFTGLGFDESNNIFARPAITSRDALNTVEDFAKGDFVGRTGEPGWGDVWRDGDLSWFYDTLGTGSSATANGIVSGKGFIDPNTSVLSAGLANQTPDGTTNYYRGNAIFTTLNACLNTAGDSIDGSISATYESGDGLQLGIRPDLSTSGQPYMVWASVSPNRTTLHTREGTFDNLLNTGAGITLVPGDIVKLEAISTTFNLYVNGVLKVNGSTIIGQASNVGSSLNFAVLNLGTDRHVVSKVVLSRATAQLSSTFVPSPSLAPSDMGVWKSWTLTNAQIATILQPRNTTTQATDLEVYAEVLNALSTVASMTVHSLAVRVSTDTTALAAPTVTLTPSAGHVLVSWPAVTNGANYIVRRNGRIVTTTASLSYNATETDGVVNNWDVATVSAQGQRSALSSVQSIAAGAGGGGPVTFAAFGIPL